MDAGERTARWPWIAVLIVAPIVVLFTFAWQVGWCEDPPAGHDSMGCYVQPQVGWPGAILIAVVCAALIVLAVVMLVRRSVRRAGGS